MKYHLEPAEKANLLRLLVLISEAPVIIGLELTKKLKITSLKFLGVVGGTSPGNLDQVWIWGAASPNDDLPSTPPFHYGVMYSSPMNQGGSEEEACFLGGRGRGT